MSMYTGTPCDECGGPTIELKFGSIWCAAEDPHAGGHFVTRVAFERSPSKGGETNVGRTIKPRRGAMTATQRASVLSEAASDREAARLLRQDRMSGGYDDFVKSVKP